MMVSLIPISKEFVFWNRYLFVVRKRSIIDPFADLKQVGPLIRFDKHWLLIKLMISLFSGVALKSIFYMGAYKIFETVSKK